MRDDRLGGWEQVQGMFAELHAAGLLMESIEEKRRAAVLLARMEDLAAGIRTADPVTAEAIRASAAYGARLFAIIAKGWELMARAWLAARDPGVPPLSAAEVAAYRQLPSNLRSGFSPKQRWIAPSRRDSSSGKSR